MKDILIEEWVKRTDSHRRRQRNTRKKKFRILLQ